MCYHILSYKYLLPKRVLLVLFYFMVADASVNILSSTSIIEMYLMVIQKTNGKKLRRKSVKSMKICFFGIKYT